MSEDICVTSPKLASLTRPSEVNAVTINAEAGVLLALTPLCLCVFFYGKPLYPRMALRASQFQLYYAAGITFYVVGELLPRVYTYPCWIVDFLCLNVVSMFGASQFARNATFLMLTRLSQGIVVHGATNRDMDEVQAVALESWRWRLAVIGSALWSLTRPEASALDVKQFEQVESLRALKFLTSGLGRLLLCSVVTVPSLVISVIIVLSDPVNRAGCTGCRRTEQLGFVIMATSALYLSFGLVVAVRVRGLPDRWGLIAEARYSVAFMAIAVLAYVLDIVLPWDPSTAFSYSIICSFGLIAAMIELSAFQVLLSRQALANLQQAERVAKHSSKEVTPMQSSPARVRSRVNDLKSVGNLAYILSRQDLADKFETFLASEFGAENLVFLRDTDAWAASFFDSAPATRLNRARRLTLLFVEPSGLLAVNLPHKISADLRAKLSDAAAQEITADLFHDARQEIGMLLEKGPVLRFRMTSEFKMLLSTELVMSTAA
jgi:hypothetical protein